MNTNIIFTIKVFRKFTVASPLKNYWIPSQIYVFILSQEEIAIENDK